MDLNNPASVLVHLQKEMFFIQSYVDSVTTEHLTWATNRPELLGRFVKVENRVGTSLNPHQRGFWDLSITVRWYKDLEGTK